MQFALLMLAALAVLASGCAKLPAADSPAPQKPLPTIAAIASSYKSYQKITNKPVYVDPELAMSCRGATQQQVEEARKTEGPHANTAILIYMNDSAAGTFVRGGKLSYAPGAVIVKDKVPGGHFEGATGKRVRSANNGVGGMVKRFPGFDPAHGDWEYFYFEDPASIEAGAIKSCVNCHAAAKATDHVFGMWGRL